MDSVVHFMMPAISMKRASKFYSKTFGWKMEPTEFGDYMTVYTAKVGKDWMPSEKGKINGGMMKRQGFFKAPVVTIDVSSIDASLKKITKAGGKIIPLAGKNKQPVGKMGWTAYFRDTEGNVMCLFQVARKR
ncbi:MAG: VOC family protein [Candidatus Micrarchaeota archaeon]|nr:VOC family protein [Candidatus Micrarchaeota archaeon]